MKKVTILLITLMAAGLAHAGEVRTLSDRAAAADIERLVLEVGVGDVEVTTTEGNDITFEVVLNARRGGFFSSKKRAEREVAEARLGQEVGGRTLYLSIDSDSDDRRFEERWTIEVPARLAFELELGVGDVEIRGIAGGIDIDAGVCDLLVESLGENVIIEMGVGDVTVKARASDIGEVECSAGVGDAHIRAAGKDIRGEGFVGHSASYRGDGPNEIQVEVGVGDIRVRLE